MKYFIGVCCAMLLGLSACGDIDSPEFPPSEVKSEVKEVVDFSYTELENLESTHGMHLNYRNRVYVSRGRKIGFHGRFFLLKKEMSKQP